MEVARIPDNEEQRLDALHRYGILDTPADINLDNIVRLASFVCGTPIALVSLVDVSRQWFKSRVGMDVTETTRDVAFCAHAILQKDVLVIRDATLDRRFVDNPLVTRDPRIRFYAGAPLTANGGLALGALCVMDHVPRDLTPWQYRALEILRDQVVDHFELQQRSTTLQAALAAAVREIEEREKLAARLQGALDQLAGRGACQTAARRGIQGWWPGR